MTAEERAAIVARLAAGESAVSLAIEAGVSRGTIYRWAREAGARLDTSRTAAATAGASARWASRRAGLADEIGEAAQKALELCSSNLDDGAVRNAKDAALAMAILVDKAELLAGNATSRNGTVADPFTLIEAGRARVHQLRPPRDSA